MSSSIEGIDKIGEQAAKIDIQGPDDEREPDALEQKLADGVEGIDRRTTVADAIREAAADEGLFDGSAYVAVPEIDGQTTDKLVIAFSGSVAYDATDEAGAALFNDLALGKAVELRVAGFVASKQGAYKVTATEEEVVTGKAVVKVDTLYVLTPEALTS